MGLGLGRCTMPIPPDGTAPAAGVPPTIDVSTLLSRAWPGSTLELAIEPPTPTGAPPGAGTAGAREEPPAPLPIIDVRTLLSRPADAPPKPPVGGGSGGAAEGKNMFPPWTQHYLAPQLFVVSASMGLGLGHCTCSHGQDEGCQEQCRMLEVS
jgi:hypothetical protein